jgi:tetraacyldisaccharide 4'-kinase
MPFKRAALYLPAKLYELLVRARIALYATGYRKSRRLEKPVISVGNLTVGGTGKTPCVAFIARYLRDEGHEVGILSRGYKRATSGLVEVSNSEGVIQNSRAAGDEPYLLARSLPGVRVVVDVDRYRAGKWLETKGVVTAFVLDDGFQHLALERNLNLILIDATDPIASAEMVPLGRLREPVTSLGRADAVIVTRSDEPFDQREIKQLIAAYCRPTTPVFYAYHDLVSLRPLTGGDGEAPQVFSRKRVATLSGIARPERLLHDLRHFGIEIVSSQIFPDHHKYTANEFRQVLQSAIEAGAEALITTEKDAINLGETGTGESELPVYVAQIEFRCEDEIALKGLLLRTVSRQGRLGRR